MTAELESIFLLPMLVMWILVSRCNPPKDEANDTAAILHGDDMSAEEYAKRNVYSPKISVRLRAKTYLQGKKALMGHHSFVTSSILFTSSVAVGESMPFMLKKLICDLPLCKGVLPGGTYLPLLSCVAVHECLSSRCLLT